MERAKSRMKRVRNRMTVAGLVCISLFLFGSAQIRGDCSNCTVYKGYISGDMKVWAKGMSELEEQYNREASPCIMYALTEARYGYAGYLLGSNDKNAARTQVDAFETDIERLAAFPEYRAETEAFRISLLGYRMALNPARAVTLGPRALKQLQVAMDAGSNSASVWIEKGNSEAHMPAIAGGSKEKAAASYREAIRLFEADRQLSECNWRYLNVMVLLGQLLEKMDDYSGAREAYMRALKREPGFKWVRDELLPAVEKKIK